LLRRKNKNSKSIKKYNKKIFKDIEWSVYNQSVLKKKKSYFDLLESYYCWEIPIIFYEKRNLSFKKKKSSNVWSIFDLKFWGREVFNFSSKSFFQIFEFEKKENVVQKNTDILNSYYNSKYRRHIIKNILSKVTIDEDFSKNFLQVFPYTESFFKRDLLFLIKHLKYLSPEKFDDFLDYDQLLNKPGILYLLKKWGLRDSFKKENTKISRKYFSFFKDPNYSLSKKKLNMFKGNFFYTEGFEKLCYDFNFDTFNNEIKFNRKKSPFTADHQNDYPQAQNYFNQNKKKPYENFLGLILYFFKKKKKNKWS